MENDNFIGDGSELQKQVQRVIAREKFALGERLENISPLNAIGNCYSTQAKKS